MHACGHDIHMSTFIGTARALGKLKDKWHGTIIFIGQPAEETVGGARALLKDGLYTRWPKPDYVLGIARRRRDCRPAKSESRKDTATRMSIRST